MLSQRQSWRQLQLPMNERWVVFYFEFKFFAIKIFLRGKAIRLASEERTAQETKEIAQLTERTAHEEIEFAQLIESPAQVEKQIARPERSPARLTKRIAQVTNESAQPAGKNAQGIKTFLYEKARHLLSFFVETMVQLEQ